MRRYVKVDRVRKDLTERMIVKQGMIKRTCFMCKVSQNVLEEKQGTESHCLKHERPIQFHYEKVNIKSVRVPRKKRQKKANWSRKKDNFYRSEKWLALRYAVLAKYGRICMCCGTDKGSMHVDHIKPRSLCPELALAFTNLQVLCKDCNMGKSNKDDKDFRPLFK